MYATSITSTTSSTTATAILQPRIDYFPCICGIPGTAASGAPISISDRRAARIPASPVRAAPSATRSRQCTRTPTPATIWAATPRPAPVHRRMVSTAPPYPISLRPNPSPNPIPTLPEIRVFCWERDLEKISLVASLSIFWRHFNSRAQRRREPLWSPSAGFVCSFTSSSTRLN